MNQDTLKKAETLVAALPYIQKYYSKTVVVKYGGNAMINESLKDDVMRDIVLLSLVGINIVLVHGGGPEISDVLKKIGKESRFINGLRYTDSETMDVVQMVLGGKVNKDLVSLIMQKGGKALGMCGIDGALFEAEKLSEDGADYGFVGRIKKVNAEPVTNAFKNGYVPVVATVAVDPGDGRALNVNADTAAAELAVALGADKLLLLTDVPGIMKDQNDPSSLLTALSLKDIPALIAGGVISGGMIPKVKCCEHALLGGVRSTSIIDGRTPHSILVELLTNEGVGSLITR